MIEALREHLFTMGRVIQRIHEKNWHMSSIFIRIVTILLFLQFISGVARSWQLPTNPEFITHGSLWDEVN